MLSQNPNPEAIELLKENPKKIDWEMLSENPSRGAIELLKENPYVEINWELLSTNPCAIELLKANYDLKKQEIHPVYHALNTFQPVYHPHPKL